MYQKNYYGYCPDSLRRQEKYVNTVTADTLAPVPPFTNMV